jgi:hypothetical protein
MDLNNPDGIANLKEFSNQLAQNLPENKDNPIILGRSAEASLII